MNRRETLLGAAAALAACGPAGGQGPAPPFPMRRGVNLGNALEAPNEGEWGYRIEDAHLRAIADAGFDGVRLPVRWDARPGGGTLIQRDLINRVSEVAGKAASLGLFVQIDMHHYDAFNDAGPDSEFRQRFLDIWRIIAESYRYASERVFFEPLNEPNGAHWSAQALRELQAEVVGVIRESNPERLIVLGPGNWQNIDALRDWRPPEGENIAVSVHYYEPHAFTHQGAEWLGDDAPTFDRAWGNGDDLSQLRRHIGAAASWARQHGYAMQLGEFGVNRAVALGQRALWTRAVRDACEAEGMGWCVWDFAGAFPIWDRERGEWIEQMRSVLLDEQSWIHES
ncbi:glycoside hydrolase family 5 protein [Terricaulis silvestris]|uniref:Endoglucanase H n=1 Tax=Terricaulis silvestris TaxID=2686094 RepID=A0A6I6MVP2_9CAUL|nr:glycoside hydrolase family 5 protein [Terricaulis silvestris]QGZ95692.1 Endoglucanase H precursor [Terricaulis silvestris]